MTQEGVPNADAEFQTLGCDGAGGQAGQGATLERILGKPDRGEAMRFGGNGEFDAALGRQAAVQTDAEPWRWVHYGQSSHRNRSPVSLFCPI
jgi:hypothetical protein